MKPGRNVPCWCGSGKKYKKCHLGRENQPRPKISEAFAAANKAPAGLTCNCPLDLRDQCNGDVIGSHTISKALGLRDLASNGHVLGLKHDLGTLVRTGGRAEIGKIGINKMSVFPGFCPKHDKELFAPVEDLEFAGSAEQCALLSYRALAREKYTKLIGIDTNEYVKTADKDRSLADQMDVQAFSVLFGIGLEAAMKDLDRALSAHHSAILSGDFSVFESRGFEFPPEFPLLCSTGHMPSEDWSGAIIQDLSDPSLKADWVTAISMRSGGRAWVIFTWLRDEASKVPAFVTSLEDNFSGSEADALIKYFFTVSENIAIRPDWWGSLSTESRAALDARIMDGTPIPKTSGSSILRPRNGEPKVIDLPLIGAFEA